VLHYACVLSFDLVARDSLTALQSGLMQPPIPTPRPTSDESKFDKHNGRYIPPYYIEKYLETLI